MAALAPLLSKPDASSTPTDVRAFAFDAPIVAFSKADAPEGQRRRIAGVISTDGLDLQKEVLVQEGLNFDYFLRSGVFNDNHSNASTVDIVGYPEKVDHYKKGDTLPNGDQATTSCTWAEGFLVGHKGEQIWKIAKDLQGTSRSLGFSVEGTINKRDKDRRHIILSADVQAVAICGSPVNPAAKLELLARSLNPQGDLGKTMSFGDTPAQSVDHPLPQPEQNKTYTGEGVGKVLTEQNPDPRKKTKNKKDRKKKRLPDFLTQSQAMAYLKSRVPGLRQDAAQRILKTAQAMLNHGLL